MKILFLHISDIHIEKSTDVSYFHVQKIVSSLNPIAVFDHVLIVVSGDIAFSGKSHQYDDAWYLFGNLIKKLKDNFILRSRPHVLVVPGNHDVDLLGLGDLGHSKISELCRKNLMDSYIDSECKKIDNFLRFAHRNRCFNENDNLFHQRIIQLENFKIEVNLLNSALFSTIEEDKGLHHFPQYVIDKLSEPSGADFVISIMHHSPHWFHDRVKSQLEKILLSKSSLLFLGHEHILETQVISYNDNPSVRVLAGGVLCNKGVWNDSQYFASILDTDTMQFTQYEFTWDEKVKIYHKRPICKTQLPPKPSIERKFEPCEQFKKSFYEDNRFNFSKSLLNYFVFPRLEKEETTESSQVIEIANESEFLTELEKNKKIIIVGYDNSGKTSLIKYLFNLLQKEKVAIFCDAYSIRTGDPKKIIKRAFEDIYGDDASFQKFEQLPKSEKVLLLDDIHLVDKRYFETFIQEAEQDFEYIIYSTKNVVELDVHERLKRLINEDKTYARYRIMPFFVDKRNELVSNVVKFKVIEKDEQEKIVNILATSLKKLRKLYSLNPEFIIQFTEYYCNNIKDAIQNDGEIFSKVFEANIVNKVTPHLKKIKIDKFFIILDKIAYFIHKNKAYPLSYNDLVNIIANYNEEYDSEVNIEEFIVIARTAKILTTVGDSSGYKFSNKNYLAYFVAREIKRRYHEDHDSSDLDYILNYSCFGINGDILLFITYITDNPNLLRLILKKTIELTGEWLEFDLDNINIQYLGNIKPLEITPPSPKEKQNNKQSEIEHEKRVSKEDSLDPINIYDYQEEDINKLYNQLSRSISLLNVITRSLSNFEHMMKKEAKDHFVDMIYRLPNRIFFVWASEIEKHKAELIELIKQLEAQDYSKDKKIITDNDALRLLQWDSMTFLLDIYNFAAVNSTKENTERYLNSFYYKEKATYSLQHLMVLEYREKFDEFKKEAETLYKETKSLTKTLIARIVRHYIIHSNKLKTNQVEYLEDKYFKKSKVHKQNLIQRHRIKQKV